MSFPQILTAGEAVDWDDEPRREMTVEEFLALPENGVSRELIQGLLWEHAMTVRNRFHASTESNIVHLLKLWLATRPAPRGGILSGEAGFRLRGKKGSVFGVNVAYVSAELLAETGPKQNIFDGPPVLAVEIMSPSDKHEYVVKKIDVYLEVGTVVWIVDPDLRTVVIFRPGRRAELFNEEQELTCEPELPGFRVAVTLFFED